MKEKNFLDRSNNFTFTKNIILLLEEIRKKYNNGDSDISKSVSNLSSLIRKSSRDKAKIILREFAESDLYKKNEEVLPFIKNEIMGSENKGSGEFLKKCMGLYVTSPKYRRMVLLNIKDNDVNVISILISCYKMYIEKNIDNFNVEQNTEKNVNVMEVAPPSEKIERFIKRNKKTFKDRYGEDWERILYATAWKMYNKKKRK